MPVCQASALIPLSTLFQVTDEMLDALVEKNDRVLAVFCKISNLSSSSLTLRYQDQRIPPLLPHFPVLFPCCVFASPHPCKSRILVVCHPKSGLYHRNPSFTDDAADKTSQDCLAALESIDDDLDEKNILAVKMADTVEARNYGVKKFPSVIVFVKKIPELYEGIRFILLTAPQLL